MPYMLGTNAIRRTFGYLNRGKLIFRNNVRIMTIHFNDKCKHSEGAKAFVHWNIPQVMYKNPDVQVLQIMNMFPTPFVRCWLDTGEDVMMDVFDKTNVEILDQLCKVLGQPNQEKKEAQDAAAEIKKDICNFGSGCARHCLCEIPGQFPCPAVVQMPKEMTGKYKFENQLYPPKGLYNATSPLPLILSK